MTDFPAAFRSRLTTVSSSQHVLQKVFRPDRLGPRLRYERRASPLNLKTDAPAGIRAAECQVLGESWM
jgi:hypothetical protein